MWHLQWTRWILFGHFVFLGRETSSRCVNLCWPKIITEKTTRIFWSQTFFASISLMRHWGLTSPWDDKDSLSMMITYWRVIYIQIKALFIQANFLIAGPYFFEDYGLFCYNLVSECVSRRFYTQPHFREWRHKLWRHFPKIWSGIKSTGIILKYDYSKTYHNTEFHFRFQTLLSMSRVFCWFHVTMGL